MPNTYEQLRAALKEAAQKAHYACRTPVPFKECGHENCTEWRRLIALPVPEPVDARLVDALEFYADARKYPYPLTGGGGALWKDCGRAAKTALASANTLASATAAKYTEDVLREQNEAIKNAWTEGYGCGRDSMDQNFNGNGMGDYWRQSSTLAALAHSRPKTLRKGGDEPCAQNNEAALLTPCDSSADSPAHVGPFLRKITDQDVTSTGASNAASGSNPLTAATNEQLERACKDGIAAAHAFPFYNKDQVWQCTQTCRAIHSAHGLPPESAIQALPPLSQVVTWIPVSERLPDKNGHYQCSYLTEFGQVPGTHSYWFSATTKCFSCMGNVTHWAEPLKSAQQLAEKNA